MEKIMGMHKDSELPVQSQKFWGVLLILFLIVMVFTMLKDWWLTSEEPNILFYMLVPFISILGGVLSMYGVAKISKQSVTFLTMLAISLGANTMMQVVENLMKIVYYLVWEYPGLLYMIIVIPLGFLLIIYGLIRWGKLKSWMALILTTTDLIGSMIIGILMTDVIGITTPGS